MTPELELSDWVERARGRRSSSRAQLSWGLLPPAEQTGFPAEYFRYLPDAVAGRFPDGPRVAALARGLRLVIRQQQQQQQAAAAAATGAPAPTPTFGLPVQAAQRMSHSNFRVNFSNSEVVLLPANPQRSYFLVVNVGAADVFIAFDRTADSVSGIPVVAGTGFLELPLGTVSEVRALTTGAAQLVVIEGLFYPVLPTVAPAVV